MYGKVTTWDSPYPGGPDHVTEVIIYDQTELTFLLVYALPPTEGSSPERSVTRFHMCLVFSQVGYHTRSYTTGFDYSQIFIIFKV